MLDFVSSFISWRMKKRYHQLELTMKFPHEVQNELLFSLINQAAETRFGQKYGFAEMKTYEDYRRQVPLHTYEDCEPLISEVRAGSDDLLWPGRTRWFAKSSGTTAGKSKYVPVSQEAIEDCHFKAGKDLLSIYAQLYPDTNIFNGKNLRLGGSTFIDNEEIGSYNGDVSAIIIENLPFWVEMRSTPNNRISLMDEWESKIEAMASASLHEDVCSLAGVPSWMLVLLRRILEMSGKKTIAEVWPNLELFMHGGVNFAPYRQQFQELIGKPIRYIETYNASEGFFGIQQKKSQDEPGEMFLLLENGIFFEFIPMDEFKGTASKAIPLCEVRTGVNYAVVISSNAGLWRYIIGDTIRFTECKPYHFVITGRTKHFLNAFGEELIVENAEGALEECCQKHQALVHEYTAAPIFMQGGESGAHQWIIEFEQPPANLENFAEDLDRALKNLNSDYEAKRYGDKVLRRLQIQAGRSGLFYDWLKAKNKLGGQNKVPRLSNDRCYVEELLELNHS